MFVSKAGTSPPGPPFRIGSKVSNQAKRFIKDKHSSVFGPFVSYEEGFFNSCPCAVYAARKDERTNGSMDKGQMDRSMEEQKDMMSRVASCQNSN